MSRGTSSGGGQSSLDYLFGSAQHPNAHATQEKRKTTQFLPKDNSSVINPESPSSTMAKISNNYHRAGGPNSGNFITERPSTKVQSAPGGGSSLGYLFGEEK